MPPKACHLFGCAARTIPLILTFSQPGEGKPGFLARMGEGSSQYQLTP